MARRKIAVIGIGKISQDQHLPVIAKSSEFELAACVSQRGLGHGDVPVYRSPAELYADLPEVELVAICTPPGVRHAYVREAIDAGKDVLLEKPPTPTISEFNDLVAYGRQKGRVLFQTWHSRYNEPVAEARRILAREGVASVRIDWRESVRKWHPGQEWVWEPGGFGVCDPGINAMSIFTEIMPFPVFVASARLRFPANRQTPVDVEIVFKSAQPHRPQMSAHFNWLEEAGEVWTVAIETAAGTRLRLEQGGTVLVVNDEVQLRHPSEEYERIYERFATLLNERRSEMDGSPLMLIADAFLLGARENVAEFHW
ncbi:MAG TPA: Gfo/Idh/MocA family oxidoreductase [Alphaproteobacteria bacterium]|nr:Gfo/Idh/MocA family oxidoreductase [Alphaproteobacteria bacterium]